MRHQRFPNQLRSNFLNRCIRRQSLHFHQYFNFNWHLHWNGRSSQLPQCENVEMKVTKDLHENQLQVFSLNQPESLCVKLVLKQCFTDSPDDEKFEAESWWFGCVVGFKIHHLWVTWATWGILPSRNSYHDVRGNFFSYSPCHILQLDWDRAVDIYQGLSNSIFIFLLAKQMITINSNL